jgi:hypothetical protein
VSGLTIDVAWTERDWRRYARTLVRDAIEVAALPATAARSFLTRYFSSPTLRALRRGSLRERVRAVLVLAALIDVEFMPYVRKFEREILAFRERGWDVVPVETDVKKRARLVARAGRAASAAGLNHQAANLRQWAVAFRDAARRRRPGPKPQFPGTSVLIRQLDYALTYARQLGVNNRYTLIARVVSDWTGDLVHVTSIENLVKSRRRALAQRSPQPLDPQIRSIRVELTFTAHALIQMGLTTPTAAIAAHEGCAGVAWVRADEGRQSAPPRTSDSLSPDSRTEKH